VKGSLDGSARKEMRQRFPRRRAGISANRDRWVGTLSASPTRAGGPDCPGCPLPIGTVSPSSASKLEGPARRPAPYVTRARGKEPCPSDPVALKDCAGSCSRCSEPQRGSRDASDNKEREVARFDLHQIGPKKKGPARGRP